MSLQCYFKNDVLYEPTPKFLMKEAGDAHFLARLPGSSIQKLEESAFADHSERCAAVLQGTVRYLSEELGLSEVLIMAEMKGLATLISVNMEILTGVYNAYNRLMVETSCDNVYVLRAFQYWQFLLDVVIGKI